jgi:hypothetical protein
MDPNFRKRLAEYGGAGVGANYSQSDAGEEVIGEGICTGCCIDWLRRELLCVKGGVAGNRFDSGVQGGMNSHYKLGKQLHDVWDAENKQVSVYNNMWIGKVNQKKADLDTSLNSAKETYNNVKGQLEQLAPALTQQELNSYERRAAAAYQSESNSAIEGHNEWLKSNPQYSDRTRADQLKKHFKETNKSLERQGTSIGAQDGGNFKDITVQGAAKLATYRGVRNAGDGTGLHTLISKIFADDDFGARRGVVVNMKIWFKDDGHSIAIYWGVGSMFYLFDPNIGVYVFKSSDQCKDAFCYIFREGYAPRSDAATSRDTGKYVNGNEVKGDYFILAWKG